MSRSGGMSQLLKGIIIGVVLIMAIIGTMSLLNKDKSSDSSIPITKNTTQGSDSIQTPAITLNPNKDQNNSTDSSNIGDLNAELPDENSVASNTENNTANEDPIQQQDSDKPVLEGEKSAEERAKELNPVSFGMMELNAVNPSNQDKLKANYVIYDKDNVKVAESTNAENASYRLPTGQYKVETTLTKIDEATRKVIPVVTKSRYMIIRENSTTKQTFELEPPESTGVLQVSAKLNDKFIRADFVVQNARGEVIASRNNVTNSLFKLNTGTYRVSVTNGNNKDFRSIEVKAGESSQTVFILKEALRQGKLLVRIFDTKSNNPIRANITISSTAGTVIQDLKDSTQTELTLAAGDYNIRVIGPNGTSNKRIRVNAGQALNEIFRFDVAAANAEDGQTTNGTKITENVTIKPVETQTTPAVETETKTENNAKVYLNVIALDERTRKPIKSNIYIQTLGGVHLAKKTYVDSARFDLLPGVYKVTVRSKNRNNLVKNIRIAPNQNVNESFLMINPNSTNQAASNTANTATNNNSSTTNNNTNVIPTGFLNVAMRPPQGQNVNQNNLRTHFIVATTAGKKIVELTSVSSGNFKLDAGSYNVTAIHNNKRRNQRVTVRANKNTRLRFNTSDFQNNNTNNANNVNTKGMLRSRIVDAAGRPLKGNLSVSNMAGRIVARANNVSTASFNLPPVRHTIRVNYQGLSGSEVVNIVAKETTMQTFTIAPNRNPAQNNNQNTNSSRDIKKILRDKIKEEIQKQF